MAAISRGGEPVFGLQLPIQTLSASVADAWESTASVADLVAIARRCDERGYGFVGVCDHVAIPDDDYAKHMTTTWYDTVATLGFLAAHTRHVRLVSTVWIAAYRHPLQTAKAFGTLAHLSGGRAILGV
ncbi:MAG: LLM class flavin-dependent oxidoreductase, partial [Deltaproteobacteria bacterium]|nr:LLM class flavin-dependent oxidoreductase [Deltaproteobacteria bacterium]